MANSELIEPAALTWRDNQPFAPRYDDIYYSGDGVENSARSFKSKRVAVSRRSQRLCPE